MIIKKILSLDLIKSTGSYTLFNVLEKAVPFLLLPVLTRFLSTEDYGIISMFSVMVGIVTPIMSLGMQAAILRNFFKKQNTDFEFPSYVFNVLVISVVISFSVGIIFDIFSNFIAGISSFPKQWLFAILIVSFGQFINSVLLSVWQAKFRAISYGVFKVLLSITNLGISVILIVWLGYHWEGRIIGYLTAVSLFGLLALYFLYSNNYVKFEIRKDYIKHALKFGIPLVPHMIGNYLINMIDRFFITNMVSLSETGIYTVGYQIGMIIGVLADAFNKAWNPWLYKQLNKESLSEKTKVVKITYVGMLILIILAISLSLIAPWFLNFFVGENFAGSSKFVFWIALGFAFKGMYSITNGYIFYIEKTIHIATITFFAALINIVLNYYLIITLKTIGAAIATTITYLVQFIFTWLLAAHLYDMPWLFFVKRRRN